MAKKSPRVFAGVRVFHPPDYTRHPGGGMLRGYSILDSRETAGLEHLTAGNDVSSFAQSS